MSVTIVMPVYNEEDNILPLAAELDALAGKLPGLEALLVDDGSTDGTWRRIGECRAKYPFLRGIRYEQNRGQSMAMLTGMRESRGDIVVTMDGDMQNDPADIPRLVEELKDCDVVCGYRADRKDTWARRAGSRLANAVRNWFTHDGIRDTGCSLKAFKKICVNDLPPVRGVHRFMPAYFKLNGRKIKEVPVNHRARAGGRSKYTNLKRLPATLYDLFGFVWYRNRCLRAIGSDQLQREPRS